MAENTLEGKNLIPSATGKAGPMPRHILLHASVLCERQARVARNFVNARGVAAKRMAAGGLMRLNTAISSTYQLIFESHRLTRKSSFPEEPHIPIEDADQP